ncbi:MAG: hypothetical protein R3200_04895 [Xanthomonadales bacterium]|nr:hypothetical protein [Xanthomonadales bacterium]
MLIPLTCGAQEATLGADDYACVAVNRNETGIDIRMDIEETGDADVPGEVNVADLVCAVGFCNVVLTNEVPNKFKADNTEPGSIGFFSGDTCDPALEPGCNDGDQVFLAVARIGQPFMVAPPVSVPDLPAACEGQ